jgi:hypothetical protein
LKEKLKADFGLALPELEEDETPEAYLARVAGTVSREKPENGVRDVAPIESH